MNEPILVADRVVAGYVRGLPIVHGVSVDVQAGEIVTIIGPNGAGKSTFLKAIAGLVIFEGGRVTYRGRDIAGLPAHEMVRAGIGFVPQTGNVFTTLSIEENLTLGGHILTGSVLRARLARAYERFPVLGERRRAAGGVLSGGQRQMLAIARALMTEPALLMLDEPTAGLSPKAVADVFDSLRALARDGVAILMVEQNAKSALRISDRGYVLAEGRNRLHGRAADILDDPDTQEAFLGGRKVTT